MPNSYRTGLQNLSLCCLTLMVLSVSACGDNSPQTAADTVALSESDELRLTANDYAVFLRDLPLKARESIAANDDAIIDKVLDYHSTAVLFQRALDQGVARQPDVMAELQSARHAIVVNAYMNTLLAELEEPENLTELARERYLSAEEKFNTLERRQVAHIFLKDNACACQKKAASERAAEIKKKLAKGVPFETLVKEYSDDRSTVETGGLLRRWVSKNGEADRAFEEKVFEMTEINEVSEPVQTLFGLHLVKLVAIEPVRKLSFEESREVLEEEIRKSIVASAMEQERGSAYPNPKTIDVESIRKLLLADDGQAANGDDAIANGAVQ